MIVGTLRVRILLRSAHSLKEKRRVLKGLKDRLANRFNISVAETDDQDLHQSAVLGIAAVGSDGAFVQSVLSGVLQFVRFAPDVEVIDSEQEIF